MADDTEIRVLEKLLGLLLLTEVCRVVSVVFNRETGKFSFLITSDEFTWL